MNSYESAYALFKQANVLNNYVLPDGLISAMKTLQDAQLPYSSLFEASKELQKSLEIYTTLSQQITGAISLLKTDAVTQGLQYAQLIQSLQKLDDTVHRWEHEQTQNEPTSWEPSDTLVQSIDVSMKKAAEFPLQTEQTNLQNTSISEPITKSYVKEHMLEIVSLLLAIISFLYTYIQDQQSSEQTQEMIHNQEIIISQNAEIIESRQTIIAQNQRKLDLEEERNNLLEALVVTLQAVNDESDIFGDQTDTVIEESDDLAQAVNSPSSDNTANREQQ